MHSLSLLELPLAADKTERTERMAEMPTDSTPEGSAGAETDVEFVLGKRQVASVLFVAIVAIAVFCAVAYVVGRSVGTAAVQAPGPAICVTIPAPPPPAPVKVVEVPTPGKQPDLSFEATTDPAPRPGDAYLQIGAVERGFAQVLVVGLRADGFPAVMTPSSSAKIFRVLIGPLNDRAAYARAKAQVEASGLNFFPRRYQVDAATSEPRPTQ